MAIGGQVAILSELGVNLGKHARRVPGVLWEGFKAQQIRLKEFWGISDPQIWPEARARSASDLVVVCYGGIFYGASGTDGHFWLTLLYDFGWVKHVATWV